MFLFIIYHSKAGLILYFLVFGEALFAVDGQAEEFPGGLNLYL